MTHLERYEKVVRWLGFAACLPLLANAFRHGGLDRRTVATLVAVYLMTTFLAALPAGILVLIRSARTKRWAWHLAGAVGFAGVCAKEAFGAAGHPVVSLGAAVALLSAMLLTWWGAYSMLRHRYPALPGDREGRTLPG